MMYKKDSNQIFIAWNKFQRRAFSMQDYFNYNLIFRGNTFKNRRFRIIDYMHKSFYTIVLLLFKRPKVLWTQLPPTPLIFIAKIYKKINPKVFIIADCHNAVFSKKWEKYIQNYDKLNSFDLILVHNHVIKEIALKKGILEKKIAILETRPATTNNHISSLKKKQNHAKILMPCGFSEDEPLATVFAAAQLIDEIQIIITGPVERADEIHDLSYIPDNVKITGYLSKEDYEKLFFECDAVLGLTTEDHIQLSVANEATGFEKPMIISDTKLLRELFYKGAVFVETLNPHSIAEGIKSAIVMNAQLEQEVKFLKAERIQKWNNQAEKIHNIISNSYEEE